MKCVDIRTMLIGMRSYRMGLIQTPDQLRFSYLAVIEGGRRILNLSDANSNVKQLTDNEVKRNIKYNICQIYQSFLMGYLPCHKQSMLQVASKTYLVNYHIISGTLVIICPHYNVDIYCHCPGRRPQFLVFALETTIFLGTI